MIRTASLIALAVLLAADTGPHQLSESGTGAYEASMAVGGTTAGVAWYDTRHGNAEVYFRTIDAGGRVRGPEHRLTSGTDLAYEPDIAALDGQFLVAWHEKNPRTEGLTAWLGRFAPDGRREWVRQVSAADRDGRNPVVRVTGDRIFCAWLAAAAGEAPFLWARWFSKSGEPLWPAQRVAPASRTTWNLNAAADGRGRMWVVFDAAAATRTEELFLTRVDGTTSQVYPLTSDDGSPSKYPDLAFHGERAALTWFDERDGNQEVYLLVAPVDDLAAAGSQGSGLPDSVERRARRITNTPGESIGAYVTWNGDRVGLAWCDNTAGQYEVYVELFDAQGRPFSPPHRMTSTAAESLIPAIRALDGGFGLVWNEFSPGPVGPHGPGGRSEVWFGYLAAAGR